MIVSFAGATGNRPDKHTESAIYTLEMSWGPANSAESLGGEGNSCAIPLTHDRLAECHYWWHEMVRTYHEPTQFRWTLGAFLQAARSVTFMLQSEKGVFPDFSWYSEWVDLVAKTTPVLKWLNDARVQVSPQVGARAIQLGGVALPRAG